MRILGESSKSHLMGIGGGRELVALLLLCVSRESGLNLKGGTRVRKVLVPLLVCAVMVLLAAAPLVAGGDWQVVKGPQGPRASAVTWDYTPTVLGQWDAKIVNNGLRSLVVDVFDTSSGMAEQISHQRIRFAAYDAYPSGTVISNTVVMHAGVHYQVTVTPNGPRGSTATVTDEFTEMQDMPPVADFSWSATYLVVSFDGTLSSDDFGIVDYAWAFGDGMTGSGDKPTHTYAAAGTYAVTLTVTDSSAQTDSVSKDVTVEAAPVAGKTITLYAIGEEPWGEWWAPRTAYYSTDFVITDSTTDGFSTQLFLPSRSPQLAYQGIIYAPSRIAVDAQGVTSINVNSPEFMPVLGTPVGGALATVDIYFQYLYQSWWNSYWIPTWGSDSDWPGNTFFPGANDGYYLGLTYSVTMNRQAAQQWIGMPQSSDPAAWWAANEAAYKNSWLAWLDNEGNNRLDIYCAYEWTLDTFGTFMDLTTDISGNVVLKIGQINWGYEALMTRWLSETKILTHEPWWEDFSLTATYGPTTSNFVSDGVAQYSMHAVKANKTADGAAWAFEPLRMDYVTKVGHPSAYNLYKALTYTSWNAGDVFFGTQVPYESTPSWLNLSAGDKFVVQMPTGTIIGYKGVALPDYAYDYLAMGDPTDFVNIRADGYASLGYFRTGANEATQPDLLPGWNAATKTLTIVGPINFDNYHFANGAIYHGVPWIEINVLP